MKVHLSLSNDTRYHESPCLDPVWNHAVCRPGKAGYPFDLDNITAGTFNTRPHRREAIGKINHLGLARRVFKDGGSLCQRRCHHQIFSTGYRHGVKDNLGALQPMPGSTGLDIAFLNNNGRAHLFERADMQVHRP